ncbi:MAG: bacteriohemerythrin [Rhodocyclaceae bacterium]
MMLHAPASACHLNKLASFSESSSRLASCQKLGEVATQSLALLAELTGTSLDGCFGFFRPEDETPLLLCGSGQFSEINCQTVNKLADASIRELILETCRNEADSISPGALCLHIKSPRGYRSIVSMQLAVPLAAWQLFQLQALSRHIGNAIDQTQLNYNRYQARRASVTTLANVAEHRDSTTGDHVQRVARITAEITQMIFARGHGEGMSAREAQLIPLASVLHDIGKIGTPDTILLKPGPLDADEREIMQKHTHYGREILEKTATESQDEEELFRMAALIARHHHERYDGKGYPDGLCGEKIPLAARIVAVSDVFDALTTERPYKAAWSAEQAEELIRSNSGTQFDPKVVHAFHSLRQLAEAVRKIEWDEQLSVGFTQMDDDHRQLIAIINRLSTAGALDNRQVIEFTLDDLVRYTRIHFEEEEQLMQELGYPDRARHKAVHDRLRSKLENIRWEYFQGLRQSIQRDLLAFLSTWLSNHIVKEDIPYGNWARAS